MPADVLPEVSGKLGLCILPAELRGRALFTGTGEGPTTGFTAPWLVGFGGLVELLFERSMTPEESEASLLPGLLVV